MSIVFNDNSTLRLNASTSVKLTQTSSTDTAINVESGSVWTRILATGKQKYQVNTTATSAAIRGTSALFYHSARTGNTRVLVMDSFAKDPTKR
jgi:hypothetical protein